MKNTRNWTGTAALLLALSGSVYGQAPAAAKSPKASAPIDLTGYWVSVVTEDWRWRMVTPAKGDYASVPITPSAKKIADAWDPAKDEAAGEQCKSYAAPALMRVPGRFRISWQDDNTLKVESDAGTQTRLFHFDKVTPGATATWQGDSKANWEIPVTRAGAGSNAAEVATSGFGSMKVQTNHIRPGYLRKNGIPFGAAATMTEFWDLNKEADGTEWMVVTTLVDDPEFLQEQWVTALHFKKEPNGAKWDPTACSARW